MHPLNPAPVPRPSTERPTRHWRTYQGRHVYLIPEPRRWVREIAHPKRWFGLQGLETLRIGTAIGVIGALGAAAGIAADLASRVSGQGPWPGAMGLGLAIGLGVGTTLITALVAAGIWYESRPGAVSHRHWPDAWAFDAERRALACLFAAAPRSAKGRMCARFQWAWAEDGLRMQTATLALYPDTTPLATLEPGHHEGHDAFDTTLAWNAFPKPVGARARAALPQRACTVQTRIVFDAPSAHARVGVLADLANHAKGTA